MYEQVDVVVVGRGRLGTPPGLVPLYGDGDSYGRTRPSSHHATNIGHL
jgi:hypothetical protein